MKKLLILALGIIYLQSNLSMSSSKITKEVTFLNHSKQGLTIRLNDDAVMFALNPNVLKKIDLKAKKKGPFITKLKINDHEGDETNAAVQEMNKAIIDMKSPVVQITPRLLNIFEGKKDKIVTFINGTNKSLSLAINGGEKITLDPELKPRRRGAVNLSQDTEINRESLSSVFKYSTELPEIEGDGYIVTLEINGVSYPATNPVIKVFNANLQRTQEKIEPITISDTTLSTLELPSSSSSSSLIQPKKAE